MTSVASQTSEPPPPGPIPEPHNEAWTWPDPVPQRFETESLVLRTYTPDDAVAVLQAVRESRNTLLPWLPWARFDHRNLGEAHATIARFARELNRQTFEAGKLMLVLGVFDRHSGRLLGGTGMHSFHAWTQSAEVGYWLRATERGRGVCTAATAAMITWGFKPKEHAGWGLRRLGIYCAASNQRSAAVARRLGMTECNRTAADIWVTGRGWDDTLRFAVLREQWDARGGRVRTPS